MSMWLYASSRFRGEAPERIPVIASPGDGTLLRGASVQVAPEPAVLVDDRTAVAEALVWGAGVGLLPSFLGEPPRAQGALYRLSDEPVAAMPVYAVYHPSQRDDPMLQALIEEISRQLDLATSLEP